MKICPKCRSENVSADLSVNALIRDMAQNDFKCNKCGHGGTFFPERTKMLRAHVIIEGRVHNVSFRAFVAELASRLNLSGFVRNLTTGAIEAVFEGSEDRVQRAVRLCRKGPRGANVEKVDADYSKAEGEFKEFEIRY